MAKSAPKGRAKVASKHAKLSKDVEVAEGDNRQSGVISTKTKKRVTKKVKFLEKVLQSAASASKKTPKKTKRITPLRDLAAISTALDELLPGLQNQVKAAERKEAPKYKKSLARQKLQEKEEDRLAAIYETKEFQANPIGAITQFLDHTLQHQTVPKDDGEAIQPQRVKSRKKSVADP